MQIRKIKIFVPDKGFEGVLELPLTTIGGGLLPSESELRFSCDGGHKTLILTINKYVLDFGRNMFNNLVISGVTAYCSLRWSEAEKDLPRAWKELFGG